MDVEWCDRYGGPANWPDPETICKGRCEGLGVYPSCISDGEWEFVVCEECGGTGKRK